MEELISQAIPYVLTVLAGVLSWAGIQIKSKITEKMDTDMKKSLAETTVKYVNQVFSDLEGADKLEKAVEVAVTLFAEKGLKVSEIELTTMLEEVVNNIKTA